LTKGLPSLMSSCHGQSWALRKAWLALSVYWIPPGMATICVFGEHSRGRSLDRPRKMLALLRCVDWLCVTQNRVWLIGRFEAGDFLCRELNLQSRECLIQLVHLAGANNRC